MRVQESIQEKHYSEVHPVDKIRERGEKQDSYGTAQAETGAITLD